MRHPIDGDSNFHRELRRRYSPNGEDGNAGIIKRTRRDNGPVKPGDGQRMLDEAREERLRLAQEQTKAQENSDQQGDL